MLERFVNGGFTRRLLTGLSPSAILVRKKFFKPIRWLIFFAERSEGKILTLPSNKRLGKGFGAFIDLSKPVEFTFDGDSYAGFESGMNILVPVSLPHGKAIGKWRTEWKT